MKRERRSPLKRGVLGGMGVGLECVQFVVVALLCAMWAGVAYHFGYQHGKDDMTLFRWNGQELEYFDHPYNHTALNMRRVEVPIIRWFLNRRAKGTRVLEVGNVLAHYGPVEWPVVDLHEAGAINADVMRWEPEEPVDLLVSISTVEHVGFGRFRGNGPVWPSAVVARLRSFLAPGGLAVVTAPTGYNSMLDAQLGAGELGEDRAWFMRVRNDGTWQECTRNEALMALPRACAGRWSGGLVVMTLRADGERET